MKHSLLTITMIPLVLISFLTVAEDKQQYRVVISFASVCCGTNADDNAAIDHYIQDYQTRHNLFLEVILGNYGDEGDFNYCFQLNELNKQHQVSFIAGLKKTLAEQILSSERTSNSGVSWVTEHGPCLGF